MNAYLIHLVSDGNRADVVVSAETWREAIAKLDKPENASVEMDSEARPYEIIGFQKIAPYVE